ncbi:MAG: murein biosynthesis integral membrane protein MurJ [Maricaulaceae bacterium]|jgi:putative peptidoglycan lipid II flippase
MSLFRSTLVIGSLTAGSRVLGFARDALIAATLGTSPAADAWWVAFRFPNLFRRVFAEGAFNSAFVPLYARRLEHEGAGEADAFASETFSFLVTVLAIFVVAAQLAMPWLVWAQAAGLASDPEWRGLAVLMLQITMPYLLFMSLMAMLSGILNARDRFALAAAAPMLLNVVLVSLLLVVDRSDPNRVAVLMAIGVLVSGVLQAGAVALGCRRAGVRFTLKPPKLTPGVKRLIALGVPGALSAGATQINIAVSQFIASFQDGAISILGYADRLYQLPLGVIGIAMGVALLPTLSKRLRAEDIDGAHDTMNRAIEIAALFTLPAAVALAITGEFWVSALFQRGAFTSEDAELTGLAVAAFAAGLPAFVAIKVLAPGFFARENTKTPMIFMSIAAAINVALGAALFFTIGFVGLAVATSVAGWVNAGLLGFTLHRDGLLVLDAKVRIRLPRLLAASAVMGVCVWFAANAATAYLNISLIQDLAAALAVAALGLIAYAIAALILGGAGLADLRAALRRQG